MILKKSGKGYGWSATQVRFFDTMVYTDNKLTFPTICISHVKTKTGEFRRRGE